MQILDRCRLAVAAMALLASGTAHAQSFPVKPVALVVPFATGGTTDIVTRLIARELTSQLGRPAIVDNRSGGDGVVGWGSVARAPADGYTLLAVELSFAIAAGLIPNLPFDPRTGFVQVVTATSVPHALVITPSLPVRNLKEFIGLARARPGQLNYGSGGNGTNTHLGAELLKGIAGIDITHIPYKGAGAVLPDLISGQVQAMISAVPTILPHVVSGRLRALFVTDDKRARVLPEVPSATEAGVPRMVMKFWVGYAVPAGTPQAIVDRLNKEVVAAAGAPDAAKRFVDLGLDAVGNTPAQAARLVGDEMDRWAAVIRTAGIKAD